MISVLTYNSCDTTVRNMLCAKTNIRNASIQADKVCFLADLLFVLSTLIYTVLR